MRRTPIAALAVVAVLLAAAAAEAGLSMTIVQSRIVKADDIDDARLSTANADTADVDVYHLELRANTPIKSLSISVTGDLLNASATEDAFKQTTDLPLVFPDTFVDSFFSVPVGTALLSPVETVVDDNTELAAAYTSTDDTTFVPDTWTWITVAVLTVLDGDAAPQFASGEASATEGLSGDDELVNTVTIVNIPEPTTVGLIGLGVLAMIGRRGRHGRS